MVASREFSLSRLYFDIFYVIRRFYAPLGSCTEPELFVQFVPRVFPRVLSPKCHEISILVLLSLAYFHITKRSTWFYHNFGERIVPDRQKWSRQPTIVMSTLLVLVMHRRSRVPVDGILG